MPDITVAADESAATKLIHDAEAALGTLTAPPGSGSFGPFTASWGASASFTKGGIDLIAPNVIRITDCELHYSVSFTFSIDLNSFLPHFCLPRVCIPIPFDGRLCTPRICINWPTITVPVSHSGIVKFTADFALNVHLSGSNWLVDIVILGIPSLQIDAEAAAILAAVGVALGVLLAPIPFIGPFLALAVTAILAAIGIAGVTGLLGPILTPFVSGLTFNVYKQPQLFTVLPAALPLDPAVRITLDAITAAVVASDEDELVLTADISPA
jgi:hypothetical protein